MSQVNNKDRAMTAVKVYLPNSVNEALKMLAKSKNLPVSRIIAYAVDNEFYKGTLFEFPVKFPETTYVEYAYATEARKIYNYMGNFTTGIGLDTLMLCRGDIGVPLKETFLLAFRELFYTEQIIEVNVPKNARFKGYHKDYKYYKAVVNNDNKKDIDKKLRQMAALQVELDKLQSKPQRRR